jgi:hypothetical protein
MAELRLQVSLNGRVLCVAGMDEFGVLTASVELTRLPGERDPSNPAHRPVEEHRQFWVEGQTFQEDDTLRWVKQTVGPGDEITIRVLGSGEHDPPAERLPNEIF